MGGLFLFLARLDLLQLTLIFGTSSARGCFFCRAPLLHFALAASLFSPGVFFFGTAAFILFRSIAQGLAHIGRTYWTRLATDGHCLINDGSDIVRRQRTQLFD